MPGASLQPEKSHERQPNPPLAGGLDVSPSHRLNAVVNQNILRGIKVRIHFKALPAPPNQPVRPPPSS